MRPIRWLAVAPLVLCVAPCFAQFAPISEGERGKPFTISANVRQEYDDNIYTASENEKSSWSSHVSPTVIFNYPMDRTLISARYTFGLAAYWDRPEDDVNMTHELVARVAHTFSERMDIDVRDRLVYAYEPDMLQPGTSRFVDGNYLINDFSVFGRYQWVPRFGNTIEYINRVVDYDSDYISTFEDRMEHTINLENRWQLLPTTVATLGYRFNMVEYNELPKSSTGHFVTVGADHKISDAWVASARVGSEFRQMEEGDDAVSPYLMLSSSYSYAPGSSAGFSFTHSLNLTDLGAYTVQTTDVLGFNLYHAFTPDFGVRVNSAFIWGRYDGDYTVQGVEDDPELAERYGMAETPDFDEFSMYAEGVLVYNINRHLSTELGYVYSHLDADVAYRSYDRNRYYIGIRGTY